MPDRTLTEEDRAILEELYSEYISEYGNISLHYAAKVGSILLTELFLNRDFKATTLDDEGHDPLFVAVQYMIFEGLVFTDEYRDIFIMLAQHGANAEALKDLEDEELNDHEAAVLTNVIRVLNNSTQPADLAESGDTITGEDAEEAADTSESARRTSTDSKASNETVASLDNNYPQQSNNTLNLSSNNNTPEGFNFTTCQLIDNLEEKGTTERQAYEEAIAAIIKEVDNQNAKAHTLQEENDGTSSSPLEEVHKVAPPFSIISDPLINDQTSSLAIISLGLFCAFSNHDYLDH